MLYLIVFYVCAGVVLTTLHAWTFQDPVGLATLGLFIPAMVLSLGVSSWTSGWALWLGALAMQVAVAGVFAALQSAKVAELDEAAAATP